MAMIEREAIIKAFADADVDIVADYGPDYGCECGFSREAVKEVIQNIPTIDPIHAAGGCYCRECKFWEGKGNSGDDSCKATLMFTAANDFCSLGTKREENTK